MTNEIDDPLQERIDAFLDEVRAKIADRGYTCIAIMDVPGYTYTVGGTAMAHGYEFIVMGLNPQTAHDVLVGCIGLPEVKLDVPQDNILHGMPVMFKACLPSVASQYCRVAQAIYGERLVKLLQVLLPDKAGKLEGDEGYDRATIEKFQPSLWKSHVVEGPLTPQ